MTCEMFEMSKWSRNCEKCQWSFDFEVVEMSYLLDVVEQASSLTDSGHDGSEVVVRQNHVSGFLADIAAVQPHGHTNVRTLQCRRVVHTVAGHYTVLATAMERVKHAKLGSRAASSEHEWQSVHLVQSLFGELVKVLSGHDSRVAGRVRDVRADDADFACDGGGGLEMVTSEHVHSDARSLTLLDGASRLHARRVVQADQSSESEIAFHKLAVLSVLLVGHVQVAVAKRKHTQTFRRHSVCLCEDALARVLGQSGQRQEYLGGALGVGDKLLLADLIDSRHALDRRVERVLSEHAHALALHDFRLAVGGTHCHDLQGDFRGLARGRPRR